MYENIEALLLQYVVNINVTLNTLNTSIYVTLTYKITFIIFRTHIEIRRQQLSLRAD